MTSIFRQIVEDYQPLLDHNILPDTELRKLVARAQKGDQQAADAIILHNVRLVWAIAKRKAEDDSQIPDLLGSGLLALTRAVKGFDLEQDDAKFSTYATTAVEHQIERDGYYLDAGAHVPIYLRRLIAEASGQYEESRGHKPSRFELLRFAEEKEMDVVVAALKGQSSVSFDGPTEHDDESSRWNHVAAREQSQDSTFLSSEVVRKIFDLAQLDPKKHEPEIIVRRFGWFGEEVQTIQEVADELGLCVWRVISRESVALRKLRYAAEQNPEYAPD